MASKILKKAKPTPRPKKTFNPKDLNKILSCLRKMELTLNEAICQII